MHDFGTKKDVLPLYASSVVSPMSANGGVCHMFTNPPQEQTPLLTYVCNFYTSSQCISRRQRVALLVLLLLWFLGGGGILNVGLNDDTLAEGSDESGRDYLQWLMMMSLTKSIRYHTIAGQNLTPLLMSIHLPWVFVVWKGHYRHCAMQWVLEFSTLNDYCCYISVTEAWIRQIWRSRRRPTADWCRHRNCCVPH